MSRRDALKATGATAGIVAIGSPLSAHGAVPIAALTGPCWIAYPGQLAAWRHLRRVKLAVERCTKVGYPANFRQPLTQAYFRKAGTAERDTPLRWSAPVARVRVVTGKRSGDITIRERVMKAGEAGIVAQIDFAQSLPALFLDGGSLSTDASWEASLDGETWVPAEVLEGTDPLQLPDADRDVVVTLPVVRVVEPAGAPASSYLVRQGQDLIVDFQDTELGSLRFETSGTGTLNVQVGESLSEVRDPDPQWFEQHALPPIALETTAQVSALPERALRFVRFSATGRATLSRVRFDAKRHPKDARGRFTSSDPELNAIWTVAVATMRSNMHDFYLDGIRRDGLIWHDGPLSLPAYERVFFDRDLSRQTLLAETSPQHPRLSDMGIIDSPMYDIIGFAHEYLVRGDAGFARMFKDRIEEMLGFLAGLQDDKGFVNAKAVEPYGFFPDWSATEATGPDPHGTPAYGQMLLAGAFAAGARLADAWGDPSVSRRHADAAARLKQAIRTAFLRRDGLFCNGFDAAGALDTRYTSFAQAFAIEFDIAEPAEFPGLIAFLNDERRRPAHYSLSQVVELSAYAKAGRAQDAVTRLRSAWLPMVKRGYRRFFEDVEPGKSPDAQLAMYGRKYAASLCHAWAGAAPVMAISRGVLGVEPLEPGYRRCRIAPQRCGLRSVDGSVPTPHGDITVSWQDRHGTATIPAGIVALVDGREVSGPRSFSFQLR